jgi:DNA repair exonuclease SbcCD ATPase subunit
MARSGIYKSEVVRARDNLIAQGRHPSIDAVRIELGNTGSKATIHRYLKEIEEEDRGKAQGKGVALSEALQSLTTRLAEQLQDEADQQVLLAKASHASELKAVQGALQSAQAEIQSLNGRLANSQKETLSEKVRHKELHDTFITETQARHTAEQRCVDLQLRLESELGHREASEAKYADARRALEHFREASKEQRDQEARQHENQVQFLQHEMHGLKESLMQAQLKSAEAFQELARLTSELGGARRELGQMEKLKGQVQGLNERLTAAQSQRESLSSQFEQEKQRSGSLQIDLTKEVEQRKTSDLRNRELEAELLTIRVRMETSEQVTEQIRFQLTQVIQSTSEAKQSKLPRPTKQFTKNI